MDNFWACLVRGDYPMAARWAVYNFVEEQLEITDDTHLLLEDVYIVWFCKTLQNWKALLSTTLPDQMYYEVTFNGDKGELYIDAYKKWKNLAITGLSVEEKG